MSTRAIVEPMTQTSVYVLLFIDIILTVSAQLLLRSGAQRLSGTKLSLEIIFEPLKNGFLLGGIILYGISFFLYVFILSKLQLNIVYPISTGVILILITLGSYFLLKETIYTTQIVGIAAILIGIVLVLLPR